MGRLGSGVIVATATIVTVGMLGGAANATEAREDRAAESSFHEKINSARASEGLSGLTWDASLANVARDHSADMAREGRLYHNQDLGNDVHGWSRLGENVGTGYSVGALHQNFMDSPHHRDNILGSFTRVGVGVIVSDDTIWVTQVFMTPASGSSRKVAPRKRTARPAPAVQPRRRAATDVRAAGSSDVRRVAAARKSATGAGATKQQAVTAAPSVGALMPQLLALVERFTGGYAALTAPVSWRGAHGWL